MNDADILRNQSHNKYPLSGLEKGLPAGAAAIDVAEIAAMGWNLLNGDLPLPVCVLRRSALSHNSRRMLRFLEGFAPNVVLCPHGKTTMSPELFRRQLADGCWGITLATFHQMRVARRFGISRIFLANQLVGHGEVAYVLEELRRDPAFDFYCLVDSVDGVERLGSVASQRPPGRPLQVLVEGGFHGGRCGVRTVDEAVKIARAVRATPQLSLVGLEGYEGLLQTRPDGEREGAVGAYLGALLDMARACDAEGLFQGDQPIIFSAGGSSFYDLIADVPRHLQLSRPFLVVVRSGCYLTHDSGLYARLLADLKRRNERARETDLSFQPALEIWCHVLSIPEPGWLVLGAGRRDFGHDAGPPALVKTARVGAEMRSLVRDQFEIAIINDQHTTVKAPANHGLKVGDMVVLSPSHPCTTFDKWLLIYEVDDGLNVVGAFQTFF